jgi:carboxylesterase
MKRRNPSHPVLPARAVLQLDAFIRVVRGEVANVRPPVLIMHGARDHTAPPACAGWLARRIGSRTVTLRMLPASFHVITLDVERDIVAREVGAFVDQQLAGPARSHPLGKTRGTHA